jgi:hypothetical protein
MWSRVSLLKTVEDEVGVVGVEESETVEKYLPAQTVVVPVDGMRSGGPRHSPGR